MGSATESSEDERPSFTGAGLGANRRRFISSFHNDQENAPAKRMKFSKQSKNGDQDAAPGYAKAGSFAARMMAKMGHKEGEGLGKEGKGRLAPIETQLRPQGAGLGAVKEKTKQAKEEEKREAAFRGEVIEDSSEEERERRKQQKIRRPGLPSATSSYQKPKIKYRTAREIELESKGLEVPDVLKALIDVSGNKTELISTGISSATPDTEASKIARRARRDLEAYAEDWRGLQERKRYYDDQFAQHIEEINGVQERAENLQKMLEEVESLYDMNVLGASFDTVAESIELLETRLHLTGEGAFEETLKTSHMDILGITVGALAPSFKKAMAEWDPLETADPGGIVDRLISLGEYLGLKENLALVDADGVPVIRHRKNGSPYDTMINTYWLPVVRTAIVNRWDVADPDPATKLVERWSTVLPPFISSILMNQLIIPRLSDAIKKWRPGRREEGQVEFIRATPDKFLFPWLSLLPTQHLNPQASPSILADLRRKFAQEIGKLDVYYGPPAWILKWNQPRVFRATLRTLYTNHLVPKIAQLIDDIDYSPTIERRKDLEPGQDWPLRSLNEWWGVLGETTLSHLLSAHFFPRLMNTMYEWLITEPDLPDIGNFIRFWQRPMDQELLKVPTIHAKWTDLVTMVKRALDLGPNVKEDLPRPAPGPLQFKQPSAAGLPSPDDLDDPQYQDEAIEQTFKDIVEDWCEEFDLMLVPLHSAHAVTGLPLHRITASASGKGGVQVYLKGDVVWAQSAKEKGKFLPVELGTELAIRGGAKL